MVFILRALTIAYGVFGMADVVSADNWPSWRGPSATGVSNETALPETWSDKTNVAWRAKLTGAGVSSPVVWGGQVFVTSQVGSGTSSVGPRLGQGADRSEAERSLSSARGGGVRFVIEALGAADGRRAWIHETPADGALPPVHDKHNLASASPVTDGRRVYAVFGTLGVAGYLGHLSYKVFEDSMMFPFALSLIGVGIIALGLLYHRNQAAIAAWVEANIPETLRKLRPAHAR